MERIVNVSNFVSSKVEKQSANWRNFNSENIPEFKKTVKLHVCTVSKIIVENRWNMHHQMRTQLDKAKIKTIKNGKIF